MSCCTVLWIHCWSIYHWILSKSLLKMKYDIHDLIQRSIVTNQSLGYMLNCLQYIYICSSPILVHCIHAKVFHVTEEIGDYLWSRYNYHTLLQKQLLVWNWKWICGRSDILPLHKQYKEGNTRGIHIICYCYNVLLVISYYCIPISWICENWFGFCNKKVFDFLHWKYKQRFLHLQSGRRVTVFRIHGMFAL